MTDARTYIRGVLAAPPPLSFEGGERSIFKWGLGAVGTLSQSIRCVNLVFVKGDFAQRTTHREVGAAAASDVTNKIYFPASVVQTMYFGAREDMDM